MNINTIYQKRTGRPVEEPTSDDLVHIHPKTKISGFSTALQDSTRIFLSFFFIEEAGNARFLDNAPPPA
jgi:hypothetical protein